MIINLKICVFDNYEVDEGQRRRGDGYNSAEEDGGSQDGGRGPEVEIKRRKMDAETDESSKRPIATTTTTTDRETMTVASWVSTASTTMGRSVHVLDKLVATSSRPTVDRATATPRAADAAEPCHRATETEPAVAPAVCRVKRVARTSQTDASVFQLRSRSVETDPPQVVNKWTSTERPLHMDKVGRSSA